MQLRFSGRHIHRLISLFCEKSVPKIKKSMYKLSDSIKNHLSIIRDVISKKELTIDRLEREKGELEKSKKSITIKPNIQNIVPKRFKI